MSSARRSLCAAVLVFEAITVALSTPVMIVLAEVDKGAALPLGLGTALACVVTAGLLRAEWGYAVGYAVQVAAIALGFVVPLMFALGVVFALLWATADRVGRKIERERAAAFAAADEREPQRDSDS